MTRHEIMEVSRETPHDTIKPKPNCYDLTHTYLYDIRDMLRPGKGAKREDVPRETPQCCDWATLLWLNQLTRRLRFQYGYYLKQIHTNKAPTIGNQGCLTANSNQEKLQPTKVNIQHMS